MNKMKTTIKNSKITKALGVFILFFLFSIFSIMTVEAAPLLKKTVRAILKPIMWGGWQKQNKMKGILR